MMNAPCLVRPKSRRLGKLGAFFYRRDASRMKIMGFGRRASAGGLLIAFVAAIALPMIASSAFAGPDPEMYDEEFVNYFNNANNPEIGNTANVYITNPLEFSSPSQPDEVCAMLYVFDPREG